ncbi:DUF805 domain-containing protein [Asticcacaulis excentricus]|uniref:Integral membrane protein n=1 Tax=Asticcacaulis excentricus TaxID=78587 RepID=A0A3G9G510_9CAUL|nr:DUF805 domain-containing protein [Asticcacaulis excentricus]BBF81857.1 integral membrane protein [Asticcacaulis excentricus]
MGFVEAVKSGLKNYVTFSGRATRSEFWWFALFQFIVILVPAMLSISERADGSFGIFSTLQLLISLGLFLPSLALSFRRLHDTNRSAWWLLISLVPLIGGIVLLVFYCLKGTEGPNKYGGGPTVAQIAETFQ